MSVVSEITREIRLHHILLSAQCMDLTVENLRLPVGQHLLIVSVSYLSARIVCNKRMHPGQTGHVFRFCAFLPCVCVPRPLIHNCIHERKQIERMNDKIPVMLCAQSGPATTNNVKRVLRCGCLPVIYLSRNRLHALALHSVQLSELFHSNCKTIDSKSFV